MGVHSLGGWCRWGCTLGADLGGGALWGALGVHSGGLGGVGVLLWGALWGLILVGVHSGGLV